MNFIFTEKTLYEVKYIIFFIFGLLISSEAVSDNLYPLPTKQQEAQFQALSKELRCLVCQNQNLADSNASLAKDLRQQVYEMVKDGQSDTEIIKYLTQRYGDFVLFNPPVKTVTVMLWFGPLLFFLFGIFIFWRTVIRRQT